MSRYWIFDRDDTPQGFPLARLVREIRCLACVSECQFLVWRCQGYGITIRSWELVLDHVDEITVAPDELERLSAGTDEWFYDLDARCVSPTESIAFGLHDSTALFLDASTELAKRVLVGFDDVRLR